MEPSNTFPPLEDVDVVERINKSDLHPINKTDHAHQYVPDLEDETDEYIAMMCKVEGCGMGFLQAK